MTTENLNVVTASATINIEKLYFALLLEDTKDNLTFATPEYAPGIRSFDASLKTNSGILYAEGKIWEQDNTLEGVETTFDIVGLNNAQQAKYLGHHIAAQGGMFALDGDVAPYLAILFKTKESDGSYTYKVYYKGKLQEPNDSAKGKEGSTDYQTKNVSSTYQPLKNNNMWKYQINTNDENCPKDIDTKFFESVIIPTEKTETQSETTETQ